MSNLKTCLEDFTETGYVNFNTMSNPMNNMMTSLEYFTRTADFSGTMGLDGDIDFERDFGHWFINLDDVGAGLDMK